MTDRGLRAVSNPSAIFLSEHRNDVAGSVVMVTQEGSRPLLVEIQALADESHSPAPRRLCVGLGRTASGYASGGTASPRRHFLL